jgi:hypothetical protein
MALSTFRSTTRSASAAIKDVVVDLVEEAGDACFHHHPPPRPCLVHDRVQRMVRRTLRPEAEALGVEVGLKDRLEHVGLTRFAGQPDYDARAPLWWWTLAAS